VRELSWRRRRRRVASFVVKSEDPRCDPTQVVDAELALKQPYCLPKQVA
jgi:hypothetical protein